MGGLLCCCKPESDDVNNVPSGASPDLRRGHPEISTVSSRNYRPQPRAQPYHPPVRDAIIRRTPASVESEVQNRQSIRPQPRAQPYPPPVGDAIIRRTPASVESEVQNRQSIRPRESSSDPKSTGVKQPSGFSDGLGSTFSLEPLLRDSAEFREIMRKITNKTIKVDGIFRVNNPYLERAFRLKKHEKILEDQDIREVLLFHGTKKENVNSICRSNFDWRLCGKNMQSRFGKGVYFSENAKYASNYCDVRDNDKVMIVAKVLIGQTCMGHDKMVLPNSGCDTSLKDMNSEIVVVKYEDSEFCPAYVIYYHVVETSVVNNRERSRSSHR